MLSDNYAIVFLWIPKGKQTGHLSLNLCSGQYISFQSLEVVGPFSELCYTSHYRTFEMDVKDQGNRFPDEMLFIPKIYLHEAKILEYWKQFKNTTYCKILLRLARK